jgi:hypothetical protein
VIFTVQEAVLLREVLGDEGFLRTAEAVGKLAARPG